eukprot:scaffold2552_cov152-Skeletonema_menzelii.AAC.4
MAKDGYVFVVAKFAKSIYFKLSHKIISWANCLEQNEGSRSQQKDEATELELRYRPNATLQYFDDKMYSQRAVKRFLVKF